MNPQMHPTPVPSMTWEEIVKMKRGALKHLRIAELSHELKTETKATEGTTTKRSGPVPRSSAPAPKKAPEPKPVHEQHDEEHDEEHADR